MTDSFTKTRSLAGSLLLLAMSTAAVADITLEVTAWKGNDTEPAAMPELIERFEAANPDISIDFSYISRSDTDVVLPPRLQGGDAPDVMMADMPLVKVWSEAGLLAPLETEGWYERLTDQIRDAITLGDKVYVMPLEVIGMGNFVNMGLLKAAGVEQPPTTIDALIDACQKLSAAGTQPLLLTGGFPAALMAIANGLEADPSAAADLGSGKVAFEQSDAFTAALEHIKALERADCFDAKLVAGVDPWSTALSEFKAGNFAMLPQGAWNIQNFSSAPDLDFAFAPLPSSKDSGVALDLFGFGWVISAQTEQADAAKTFVEFFTDDNNLQELLKAESAYSPFKDGTSGVAALAQSYDTARANGGTIMFPFGVLSWPKALEGEIFDSMTGYLLDLDKDPADILSRWDEIIEDQ